MRLNTAANLPQTETMVNCSQWAGGRLLHLSVDFIQTGLFPLTPERFL